MDLLLPNSDDKSRYFILAWNLRMQVDKIKPIANWVFLEVIEEDITPGGIIIPIEYRDRFPQSGVIIAQSKGCKEDLRRGDTAILVNEGLRTDNAYWAVCSLTLKDWPQIEHCDIEVWPVIKEQVEIYRSNPSTHDRSIHVKTIDSTSLSFLASDVLDYEVADLTDSGLRLEYVNAVIIHLTEGGLSRRYYFVRESDILATVWREPNGRR
jgi:hypothetical protein